MQGRHCIPTALNLPAGNAYGRQGLSLEGTMSTEGQKDTPASRHQKLKSSAAGQALTQLRCRGGLAAPLLLDPPPVVDHFLGHFDDSS